ncbi:hypothetical protein RhiirA4_450707 [Rhizophagus irregularis]|uniref:Uncharacterized protein n=1 Tax=Rhizophagus irregularis TaxID=588596 RepID=A0A2I1FTU0_9GLOM|nr:hypothetical protein RhiirA4_450707 [Rhizophagus irregularis]
MIGDKRTSPDVKKLEEIASTSTVEAVNPVNNDTDKRKYGFLNPIVLVNQFLETMFDLTNNTKKLAYYCFGTYALTEVEASMSSSARVIAFKVKQVPATEVIVSIESWVQTSRNGNIGRIRRGSIMRGCMVTEQ